MIILILWWSSKDLSSYVLFRHVAFVHSTILNTHVFVTISFNGILFRYGGLHSVHPPLGTRWCCCGSRTLLSLKFSF